MAKRPIWLSPLENSGNDEDESKKSARSGKNRRDGTAD